MLDPRGIEEPSTSSLLGYLQLLFYFLNSQTIPSSLVEEWMDGLHIRKQNLHNRYIDFSIMQNIRRIEGSEGLNNW